jgi:hypothetical protein
VAGVEGFGYLVGPGPDFGPTLGARIRAAEPVSDTAATARGAAAASRARAQARAHRRQRTAFDRGYRYEYLLADEGSDKPGDTTGQTADNYAPAGQGAGTVGFAGTVPTEGVRPAGLITIAGDGFGGGPTVPMLPDSWTDGPKE